MAGLFFFLSLPAAVALAQFLGAWNRPTFVAAFLLVVNALLIWPIELVVIFHDDIDSFAYAAELSRLQQQPGGGGGGGGEGGGGDGGGGGGGGGNGADGDMELVPLVGGGESSCALRRRPRSSAANAWYAAATAGVHSASLSATAAATAPVSQLYDVVVAMAAYMFHLAARVLVAAVATYVD